MMVIDASVAMKWLQEDEKERDLALKLYENHRSGQIPLSVPEFMFLEIANALATKSRTSTKDVLLSLKFIFNASFMVIPVTNEDIQSSAKLAKKYHLSAYDMLYAVQAKRLRTILITADRNFIAKTKFRHVKLLSEYQSKNFSKRNEKI